MNRRHRPCERVRIFKAYDDGFHHREVPWSPGMNLMSMGIFAGCMFAMWSQVVRPCNATAGCLRRFCAICVGLLCSCLPMPTLVCSMVRGPTQRCPTMFCVGLIPPKRRRWTSEDTKLYGCRVPRGFVCYTMYNVSIANGCVNRLLFALALPHSHMGQQGVLNFPYDAYLPPKFAISQNYCP